MLLDWGNSPSLHPPLKKKNVYSTNTLDAIGIDLYILYFLPPPPSPSSIIFSNYLTIVFVFKMNLVDSSQDSYFLNRFKFLFFQI